MNLKYFKDNLSHRSFTIKSLNKTRGGHLLLVEIWSTLCGSALQVA